MDIYQGNILTWARMQAHKRRKKTIQQNLNYMNERYVKMSDARFAMQKAMLAGNIPTFAAAQEELERKSVPCPPSKSSKAELALWIALILVIPVSMWGAATALHPFWRTFDDQGGPGNCRTEMEGTHPQYPSKVDERGHPNNGRK